MGVEYRCAGLPLTLGEAMMIIRILFAGLHAGATPITDDPCRGRACALVTGAE